MKTTTFKLISVILCLLIFCSAVTVFAEEAATTPYENFANEVTTEQEETTYEDKSATETEEDTTQDNEPTTQPDEPPTEESDTVAKLSVVIRNKGLVGHVWLYIENLTDKPIDVGLLTVQPNEGVSVGLLSFSRADGWGIYYNIETYCCNNISADGCTWLTEELDLSELESVSKQIGSYTNYWDPFFNCVFFAFKIWNTVSDKTLIPLVFPILGTAQMRIKGAESGNVEMFCPNADNVFRQRGTGKNARLEPVSEKSLTKAV